MKRTRKGAAVLFLAAVLTLGQPSLGKLYGDTSALTAYTTERTEDKSWYVHTFTGGGSFLTSVNQGTITSRPVSVIVPAGFTVAGDEYVNRADVSETDGGTLYRFSEAGTCSIVITVQDAGGKSRYGRFYFTILSSPETSGQPEEILQDLEERPFQVVRHRGGASYTTTIREGDVLQKPASVTLGAGMEAVVLHNGRNTAYQSGDQLREPGSYEMTFTSSSMGRKETSRLSFTIGEIVEPEPGDYGVSFPIDPSFSVNPDLADVGKPAVGEWTWENSIKNEGGGSAAGTSGGSTRDPWKVTVLDTEKAEVKTSEIRLLGTADDEDSGVRWSSRDEDAYTGPGAIKTEEETQDETPKEVMVQLSETYHEDYKLYELSFANQYFFYSNVGDGDITSRSKPVVFDVPSNISVKAQKDGISVEYNNKAQISEPGSYLFELSVLEGQDRPVKEQTVYKAVYHFRIEEKEPETQAAVEAGSFGGSAGFGTGLPGTFTAPGAEETSDPLEEARKQVFGTENGSETGNSSETKSGSEAGNGSETENGTEAGNDFEAESGQDGGKQEGTLPEDGEKSIDIDRLVEELTTPETKEEGPFTAERCTGLEESYDAQKGQYREKLRSGTVFYAGVPAGMVTNQSVALDIPSGLTVIATRDDQPFEYVPGEPVEESGVYRFEFQEDRVDYTVNYDRPPFYTFRIGDEAVNDMEILNMPEGFEVVSLFLGDEEIKVLDTGHVFLNRDGVYHVVMSSQDTGREYRLDLEKDTQAPQFTLDGVQGGVSTGTQVRMEYLSGDIDRAELYRDGVRDESFNGVTVSEPGNYQLFVYDKAGNMSSARFQMRYKMNLAAVMAIVLVILIAGAVVVYVKKVKRDVSVR